MIEERRTVAPPVFPESWDIRSARLLADTPTSHVWEVTQGSHGLAIVKDFKPAGIEDEFPGIETLEWRDGDAAVRVLGRDGHRVLMEHAGDYTLLDHLNIHGDDAASEIAAEAILRFHGDVPRPAPEGLQPLRQRFKSLFEKATSDRKSGIQSIFMHAAETAERLLANQRNIRPLHADLHHENLIRNVRGWLVIDPKGVIGDPLFDTANLFYNPLDRMDLRASPARASSLARLLESRLGWDRCGILEYAFAHACLSASWHVEDGNLDEAERSLAVARAAQAVLQQES